MDKKVYEFISQQSGNPIVQWRTCKASGEQFPIYQGEIDLLEKISPVIGGKKMLYDLPKYCYRVRMLKRQLFRNERKFYSVPCAGTDKKEISIVHDSIRKVMPVQDWQTEDFSTYAVEYSGNFRQDMQTLFEKVPYLPRFVFASENSDYCNQSWNEKNCYLCVGGQESENCFYTMYDVQSKYIIDSCGALKCEIVYGGIHNRTSMKAFFCTYLVNCYNTRFGYDLQNCKNVLFGFGLRDKEYIFKNKQYPKEEREKIFQEYAQKIKTISGLKEVQEEFETFKNSRPHEATHNVNMEHSRGTQINNSKNVFFGFGAEGDQDVRYSGIQGYAQDVMDVDLSSMSQTIYNCTGATQLHGCSCIASNFGQLRDSYYGLYMRGGENQLGCFGLQNQSYHILNKEYPKQEREKLALQIIQELQEKGSRGEFLPTEFSPFPYNDTQTSRLFPIKQIKIGDKIEVLNPEGVGTVEVLHPHEFISDALLDLGGDEKLKIKWRTQESEINIPTNVDVIEAEDLPDSIDDVTPDICEKVIICEETGRPFRIMPMELDFYKKNGLPLPTTHYEWREMQIYNALPPRFLDLHACDNCGKEVLNERRPGHTYKMYCADCYNKEVYG